MTREEYYAELKKKKEAADWSDLNEIRKYNEFARELRNMMEWEA